MSVYFLDILMWDTEGRGFESHPTRCGPIQPPRATLVPDLSLDKNGRVVAWRASKAVGLNRLHSHVSGESMLIFVLPVKRSSNHLNHCVHTEADRKYFGLRFWIELSHSLQKSIYWSKWPVAPKYRGISLCLQRRSLLVIHIPEQTAISQLTTIFNKAINTFHEFYLTDQFSSSLIATVWFIICVNIPKMYTVPNVADIQHHHAFVLMGI